MTPNSSLAGAFVEPQVIRKQYAMELAVERTRLLYQGSLLPTLFMVVNEVMSVDPGSRYENLACSRVLEKVKSGVGGAMDNWFDHQSGVRLKEMDAHHAP